MSISAKAMAITGIEDRRYWNWIPTEESRLVVYAFDIGNRLWNFRHEHLVKFLSCFLISHSVGCDYL